MFFNHVVGSNILNIWNVNIRKHIFVAVSQFMLNWIPYFNILMFFSVKFLFALCKEHKYMHSSFCVSCTYITTVAKHCHTMLYPIFTVYHKPGEKAICAPQSTYWYWCVKKTTKTLKHIKYCFGFYQTMHNNACINLKI